MSNGHCHVYPQELSAKIRQNLKLDAECIVYDELSTQLKDPNFHVFYSKDWLNRNLKNICQEDGECDFIVAHPELGILFIEVKGGCVRKDGKSDEWYSGKNKIKNPVRQARTSKHIFLESLREHWGSDMPFFNLTHCVLLPHSSTNKTYLGEGMPIEIFGFMEDMPLLAKKIYNFYDFEAVNSSRINGKLGSKGIELIKNMFAKDIDFSPRLKEKINRNNYLIDKLTETQNNILKSANKINRLLIEGPAGSGKTVLAIKKGLSEALKDRDVLLTCFNKPLIHFIKNEIGEIPEKLRIKNFHSLCKEICLVSEVITQSEIDSNPENFLNNIVEHTLNALEKYNVTYDSIIIDEGQDLEQDWWEIIEMLSPDREDAKIIVFRDDNQKIRFKNNADYKSLNGPIMLFKNVRNTQHIAEASLNFYKGSDVENVGPVGDPLSWHSSNNLIHELKKLVRKYITYENVNPNDIAILTLTSVEISGLAEIETLESIPVGRSESIGRCLIIDTVSRFKGLEAEVIILLLSDKLNDELFYTGISRAKTHLAFLGNKNQIESVRSLLDV